jgi:DNA-binding transcriptional LysR family regulator
MLNPVHLHTLSMVLRTGSFTEAARRLGYTSSAVSQQISTLERQLKVQLFERNARSITATPVAEFIVSRSGTAMGALHALEDDIDLFLSGAVGRLRLGSFPTGSERLLPDALPAFMTAHPRVEVHLDEGEPDELLPLLESREIDIALVYRYNLAPERWSPHLSTHPVLREDLLLVGPGQEMAGSDLVRLSDLRDRTWISTREGTGGAAMMRHLCREAGFEPSVSYRSNNYGVIQDLVRAGLGIALIPALGVCSRSGLHVADICGSPAFREVLVVSSLGSPPALLEAFASCVRTAARETAAHKHGLTYLG